MKGHGVDRLWKNDSYQGTGFSRAASCHLTSISRPSGAIATRQVMFGFRIVAPVGAFSEFLRDDGAPEGMP
jgi:hypothetical protein